MREKYSSIFTEEHSGRTFHHILFLDVCESYHIVLTGLPIKNLLTFSSSWNKEITKIESNLTDHMILEYVCKPFDFESQFSQNLRTVMYKKVSCSEQGVTWKDLKRTFETKNILGRELIFFFVEVTMN